ncbi:hypothetical protein [Ureibacillus aquaedulcis]|uniref:Uncharacterized protein n=1 Tax=Ureibacillus aquaedulcis TaxID=3058421 RepID=A0ABT8GN42_9BACL|nr:hypothetical protein [Ureibacillus sp. BA0131]MDN4492832.1 hypothetical protein [Ureibacillus sp. BA0131]
MKNAKHAVLGILTGLFIIPIIDNWLGLRFDHLLYKLFGEPDNPLSVSLSFIFTLCLIAIVILLPLSRKKAKT